MVESRPRIVLVSGYHYRDDPVVRHAISEGVICGFLAKPFTNKDLLNMLHSQSLE
jgi:FixJ family two-component response regulator